MVEKIIIKNRGRDTPEIDITQQTTKKGKLHFLLVLYNVKAFKTSFPHGLVLEKKKVFLQIIL